MPRSSWYDDNMMQRDRSERSDHWDQGPNRDRERGRDDGAFFSSGRDERHFDDNDRSMMRSRYERDRNYGSRERNREHSRHRDEHRQYGADDYNRGVPMDETKKLIASNKVEGTPVYDRHGDKLGTIHNFMVDKRRGHVVYAVLKHSGGFLGFNERYYPIEWDQLTYDTRLDGYHVDLVEEDLKGFGSFDSEGRWHQRRTNGRDRSDRQSDRW